MEQLQEISNAVDPDNLYFDAMMANLNGTTEDQMKHVRKHFPKAIADRIQRRLQAAELAEQITLQRLQQEARRPHHGSL